MENIEFGCIIKADVLKRIVNLATTLTNEIKLKIGRDGIASVFVDPAHATMINLNIKKEICEEYKYITDVEIGVDVDKLKECLKQANKNDCVKLECDTNYLQITFNNMIYNMSLLNLENFSNPKIPDLTFPAKATINAEAIKNTVKACKSISDNLKITLSTDKLTIIADNVTDKVKFEIQKDLLKELVADNTHTSLFSIDYLQQVMKHVKKDSDVTLYISDDYPLKLFFKIDGQIDITYILAPRIESE